MHIIYTDRDMIVVWKEAGLPVQSRDIRCTDLTDLLRRDITEKTGKIPYLGIVHRLDQPVRGLVVFALNQKAAADLSSQLSDGRMKKYYSAIVRPEQMSVQQARDMLGTSGCLQDYLKKDSRNNTAMIVSANMPGAKLAKLEYCMGDERSWQVFPEVDSSDEACIPLEIHLLTGRHHQIRAQLSHAGIPILGDRKYGAVKEGDPRVPCLCASRLELFHPGSGRLLSFACQNPENVV